MGSSTRGREGNFPGIFGRNEINALIELFRSMAIRPALPSFILAAVFSGAARSVASIAVEDEDGAVFAGDFDWLAGVRALVEQGEIGVRREWH